MRLKRVLVLASLLSVLLFGVIQAQSQVATTVALEVTDVATSESGLLHISETVDTFDSSQLGGGNTEWASAMTRYGDYLYVVGHTSSVDWPSSPGSYQETLRGGFDVFVACYDTADLSLRWGTYIGGELSDYAYGAVATSDGVWITGHTENVSTGPAGNFPTTGSALNGSHNGNFDIFLAYVSSNGSTLLYSTFLGGFQNDRAYGMTLVGNKIAVVGSTESNTTFPLTANALDSTHQGNREGFLLIMNESELSYSSFLGGSGYDEARSIVVGPSSGPEAHEKRLMVGGISDSGGGWGSPGAIKTLYPGYPYAGWIAEHNFSSSWACTLSYSTWLGSVAGGAREYEYPRVDWCSKTQYYSVGASTTYNDWPVSSAAYQSAPTGDYDIWIGSISTGGLGTSDLRAGSYFGGPNGDEHLISLAVDERNRTVTVGSTTSAETPVHGSGSKGLTSSRDILVTRWAEPSGWGMDLLYSSMFTNQEYDEAVACVLDGNQDVFLTGGTTDTDAVSQDSLTAHVILPDPPNYTIIKLVEPNATGLSLKIIANVTSSIPTDQDEFAEVDSVEMTLWYITEANEWAHRSTDAELIDEDVPDIFEARIKIRDNESGDFYWTFDCTARDRGRRRLEGSFLIGESRLAKAPTDDTPPPSSPVQELVRYLVAVGVVAAIVAFGFVQAPKYTKQGTRVGTMLIATFAGVAGLVFGAALIPWYEALVIFGFTAALAMYVGGELVPQNRLKKLILGLIIAFVGLAADSAYYVTTGVASIWWPVGFGLGGVGLGIYYASIGRKVVIKWKFLTLKRLSLIFSAVASVVTVLVMLGII